MVIRFRRAGRPCQPSPRRGSRTPASPKPLFLLGHGVRACGLWSFPRRDCAMQLRPGGGDAAF
eukprot:9113634-Lingulodinium_polyedra.AAC.1